METKEDRLIKNTNHILKLVEHGFKIEKLTDYHYRVNGEIDVYPVNKKYHILESNKRGVIRNQSIEQFIKERIVIKKEIPRANSYTYKSIKESHGKRFNIIPNEFYQVRKRLYADSTEDKNNVYVSGHFKDHHGERRKIDDVLIDIELAKSCLKLFK